MLTASPYIHFHGQAHQALEFYHRIFGGTLDVMLHSQFNPDPAVAGLLMHGQLDTPGFTIMAADDPYGQTPSAPGNVMITIWGDDLGTAQRWFDALSDGGKVSTEFAEQMWGDHYGDLVDRFGITWAIDVTPLAQP